MKQPNIYPIPVILLTVTIILTATFIILLPQVWYMGFIAGPLGTLFLAKLVCSFFELKRRKRLGIDLFAVLEKDRRAVKDHMLFIMQFGHSGGIKGALKEFNTIFRNYPQWHLENWEVFRAWYKHQIDHMVQYPKIYVMTMKKDGSPYSKEKDDLYDPDAPDWDQFDRIHYYDE